MSKKVNLVIRIAAISLILLGIVERIFKLNVLPRATLLVFVFSLLILILTTFVPAFCFEKKLVASDTLYYMLLGFVFLNVVLGLGFGLFVKLPSYNKLMHLINAIFLTVLNFAVLKLFTRDHASHLVRLIFASFLITITLGVFFEIFKFGLDHIFDFNLQRYNIINTDYAYQGQKALYNTMNNLTATVIGSLISTIVLFLSVTKNQNITSLFYIRRIRIKKKR